MARFKIDFEFHDMEETRDKLKHFNPERDDYVKCSYGKIIIKMDGKVVNNPLCKPDHPFYGKYTDSTWLLFPYWELLTLLYNGFTEEGTRIPFLDNSLDLYFKKNNENVDVYFTYSIIDKFDNNRVIESVTSTPEEISKSILQSFDRLYQFFIDANPIFNNELKHFKTRMDECKKKYNIN